MSKNVIIGQSGGPTAVINSSLAGVYKAACSPLFVVFRISLFINILILILVRNYK